MEPLLGGRLANPPKPIKDILRNQGKGIKPSDLALQWLWNQPEVSVVLSGMSTMGQVRGNIKSANMSGTASLGKDGLRLVESIKKRYRELVPIPCTKCSYCMPCPNGVNIPKIFEEYIDGFIHDDVRTARSIYSRFFKKEEQASQCKACKKCEAKCPQKIPISELMPKVHAVLGEGQPYPELGLSASIV
jgi:predicted aldo/keto reductase-like oxidoreductase